MFTIIIPTHQRSALLRRTLASLAAQTYRDFSVIIVSDTPDVDIGEAELSQLPGPYRLVVRNGRCGPAESRNLAHGLVETPYVIYLDDDDSFMPDHLESLAAVLADQAPQLWFCSFHLAVEDRTNAPPLHISEERISISGASRDTIFIKNVIPNSCVIYPSSIVRSLKYDPDLVLYEDWDFLLNALKLAPLRYIDTAGVRIHKSYASGQSNERRGRSNEDRLVEVTLEMYRRHSAPNTAIRLERQAFFAHAGMNLGLEFF